MDIIVRIQDVFSVRVPERVLLEIETGRQVADAVRALLGDRRDTVQVPEECHVFERMPEYVRLMQIIEGARSDGEPIPYFAVHDGVSTNLTIVDNQELINFSGNNYLGMSGDPIVANAAKEAIDEHGTSMNASRLVSGTRSVHTELEKELAELAGMEAAITFNSGFLTNATAIGNLMEHGDLILHDELSHNSIIVGCQLSGATRRPFPHNDWQALDDILTEIRADYRKVLVIIEGVYSMDGDYPDFPRFIEVKNRHKAWLFTDEAHAFGVMGMTGRGMCELYDIDATGIEIRMGTLSKAFGASGGFIAARKPIVEFFKYTAPGVVFSGALTPPSAAAALAAIRLMKAEPGRVATLKARGNLLRTLIKQRGFDTGTSKDTPIVPVFIGHSINVIKAARLLHERGISVQPIFYPAVSEETARIRFFVTTQHTTEQLTKTARILAEVLAEVDPNLGKR